MHLRMADPLGDLRLRHVLGETQAQHQALAVVEVGEGGVERDPPLDQLECLVLGADPLGRRRFLGVVGPGRAVERERPPVVVGLHHLEHVGLLDLEPLGDLADRGRALQLLGQRGDRFVDFGHPVVQAARHPHRPDAVAEVAFELAEDRRRGEGGEGDAALGIEAVDRAQQAEVRHLQQVVEGLARSPVAERQPLGEVQVSAHELFPDRRVTLAGKSPPQLGFFLYRVVARRGDPLPASTPLETAFADYARG